MADGPPLHRVEVSFVGAVATLTGDITGTSGFSPLVGDCVNTPVTRLQVVEHGHIVT